MSTNLFFGNFSEQLTSASDVQRTWKKKIKINKTMNIKIILKLERHVRYLAEVC